MRKMALRSGPLVPFDYGRPNVHRLQDLGCTVGIDVSHWQGGIDWDRVAGQVDFAYIRFSDGSSHPDERFEANWSAASQTDLLIGPYQYVRGSLTATQQALELCEAIEGRNFALPPAIDVEDPNTHIPASFVLEWCEVIIENLHRMPIVYTTPSYWQETFAMAQPLWISHVQTWAPLVPEAWGAWLLWQMSWKGKLNGIYSDVDIDVYDGTLDQLTAICDILQDADAYRGWVGQDAT